MLRMFMVATSMNACPTVLTDILNVGHGFFRADLGFTCAVSGIVIIVN